ncbi:MAG: glycoside hydrolase family 57 protein [Candidatus Brocadiia bacterium]
MPVNVAFLWHQHQPFYKDTLSGRQELPWVRLHGIKDYWGMAETLRRYPGIKATFNFVPSLLTQLQDLVDGQQDVWATMAAIPASELSDSQRRFALESFFYANLNNMIRPFPRFFELFSKRGEKVDDKTVLRFSEGDYRDLQVLANLAWFHPYSLEDDAFLDAMVEKGRGYTEEEKKQILVKQVEILAQVIPLHRKLLAEGRIEISTTPFYHPIIPLLIDERSVWEAMPGAQLPRRSSSLAVDAQHQIRTALDYTQSVFGSRPKGMWPSEGSVSEAAGEMFCEAGVKWIATDQKILENSICDMKMADRHPYRPYRLNCGVSIVFRDHALSDLISFQYQYYREEDAVADFIGKLRDIARRIPERPACIFIIMDGENAWECYRQSGRVFFDFLYRRLQDSTEFELTTVGDYILHNPPGQRIDKLAAGSWINGDFSIWAGHSEDIKAWEYLDRVREDIRAKTSPPDDVSETAARQAWEEIYIAEGSDYFWWYGEDHSSPLDLAFDSLFRMHLKNAYRHLGEPLPEFLDVPIKKAVVRSQYSQPSSLLNVKIDGKVSSFFEWNFAGRYDSTSDYGAMARVYKTALGDVFYGFNATSLFVRADFRIPEQMKAEECRLVIEFRHPIHASLSFPLGKGKGSLLVKGGQEAVGEAAVEKVFECSLPLSFLRASPGDAVEFTVNFSQGGRIAEVAPRTGAFSTTVPPADFDSRNWGL